MPNVRPVNNKPPIIFFNGDLLSPYDDPYALSGIVLFVSYLLDGVVFCHVEKYIMLIHECQLTNVN